MKFAAVILVTAIAGAAGATAAANSVRWDGRCPTSGTIAFERMFFLGEESGSDVTDVWRVNADGSGQRNLTGGDRLWFEGRPAWSPDGRRIAYEGTAFGGGLVTMTRDGRGVRRLTRLSVYYPTWSPSGHTIALTSNLGAVPGTRIGVMSARGGSIRWLPRKGKDSGEPDWSSTGQITFIQRTGYRDETLEVFVMSPDGTGRRRLTHNREQEATPPWSPDASRVAFHGERGIYVINTDGTGLKRITNGSEDWSPT